MSENTNKELKISNSLSRQENSVENVDVTQSSHIINGISSQEIQEAKRSSETSMGSHQASKPSTSSEESTSKICRCLRICEIECFLLLFGVVSVLMGTFQDNVLYNHICHHQMEKGYKKCFNLENTPNISRHEIKVHGVLIAATSHKTAILVIKLPIEFASSMFLCSWSDSYGRKFPIIAAILSGNFDLITYFFRDSYFDGFMGALYTNTVLSSLFGGTICVYAMSYSYGTDHSSVSFRTFKFSTMDVSFVVGTIVGSLVLRNFPSANGLLQNVLLSLSLNLISVIWIFFVFEDKNFEGKDKAALIKFKQLFSPMNAGSSFKVLWKWRSNCQAEQLRMIVVSSMPTYIAYGLAEGTILSNSKHASYFQHFKQYNRTMNFFGLYSCVLELGCMAFIHFWVKLKDSTIGLLGFFSLYLPSFLTAFVSETSMLIIAMTLAAVKSFSSIALRSTTSKISDTNEIGRTFLFVSLSEVTGLYAGYIWHTNRYFILGQRTLPDFSYFLKCTFLVIPFCYFMFQVISIHTEELFQKCYRSVAVPADALQQEYEDTSEEFDA